MLKYNKKKKSCLNEKNKLDIFTLFCNYEVGKEEAKGITWRKGRKSILKNGK